MAGNPEGELPLLLLLLLKALPEELVDVVGWKIESSENRGVGGEKAETATGRKLGKIGKSGDKKSGETEPRGMLHELLGNTLRGWGLDVGSGLRGGGGRSLS